MKLRMNFASKIIPTNTYNTAFFINTGYLRIDPGLRGFISFDDIQYSYIAIGRRSMDIKCHQALNPFVNNIRDKKEIIL